MQRIALPSDEKHLSCQISVNVESGWRCGKIESRMRIVESVPEVKSAAFASPVCISCGGVDANGLGTSGEKEAMVVDLGDTQMCQLDTARSGVICG